MSEQQNTNRTQGPTRTINVRVTVPAHLSGDAMSRLADAVGGLSNVMGADNVVPLGIDVYDPSEFEEDEEDEERSEAQPDAAKEDPVEGWDAPGPEDTAPAPPTGESVISVPVNRDTQRDWTPHDWFRWAHLRVLGVLRERVQTGVTLDGITFTLRKVDDVWHPAWRFSHAAADRPQAPIV